MFILLFVSSITIAAVRLFTAQVSALNREHSRCVAFHLAEGGIEWALAKLRRSRNYHGESELPLGDGILSIVVRCAGDRFEICSSGRVMGLSGAVIQTVFVRGRFVRGNPIVDLWSECLPTEREQVR